MSVFGCGLSSWNRKIKDPGLSKEAKKRIYDKVLKLAHDWERGTKEFKNVKDLGWNDTETFHDIYERYTHKVLDPDFMPTNFKDIKKFELGLHEYNERLAKPSGVFARNFFLPKAAMQHVPELRKFEQNLTKESSYFRRYSVETGKQVNDILNDFNVFASGMGAANKYPSLIGGKGIIKGVNSQIRKIYNKYQNLQERLPYATSSKEKASISDQLRKLSQEINSFYEKGAGESFIMFNNVLQGADIETIPRINSQQKQLLRKMKANYVEIRKSGVTGLIRGLEKIKQMAKEKDLLWVDSTVEKINGLIKQIEFQQRVDTSGEVVHYKDLQSERDFIKLGFKTEEGYTAGDKKVAFSKHYMSQYTLGLLKTVKHIDKAVHEGTKELDVELKREIDNWEGITDRAKGKNPLVNTIYDNDPFFFLKKYTSDIGIFNHRVHLKSNLAEAVTTLTKEHLEVAREAGRKDLEESALSMLKVIRDVNEHIQLADPTAKGWVDDIARVATSYTYFRLMGGNIRSAARNGTQRVYELVEFGLNNVKNAYQWYSGSGLSAIRNTKLTKQLQRFGLQWFDGKSVQSNLLSMFKGEDIKMSEASRGALEEAHVSDANLYVNKNGELTIHSGERVTEKVARGVGAAAGSAGFMHKAVEDWNRSRTFKTAFALIHNNLESADRGWIAKQMLDVKEIKKLKGEDYEVGYKDLLNKFQEKTDQRIDAWVENKAGRMAYNATLDLHFEYAKWNKAKIVRANERDHMLVRGLKTGIGQFSHYRFSMFNLMHKWYKEGTTSWKAGDFTSQQSGSLLRMGMLQLMISGMSIATKVNLQKLMPNDVIETAEALYYWLETNRQKLVDGGVDSETAEMFNKKTYGQGGWYFLGPNVPYLLGAAEIIHKTYDPSADALFDRVQNQTLRNPEAKALYDKYAMINSQLARFRAYTLPMMGGGGSAFDVMRLELGLFPSKIQRDANLKVRERLGIAPKKKRGKSGLDTSAIEAALDLF